MMRAGVVRAGLAMAGIFVAGMVAGGFAGVAWQKRNSVPMPPNAQEFTARHLERMARELELTEVQQERIRPKMEGFADQFRQARRKAVIEVNEVFQAMNAELEAELTAAQIVQHRAYLEEQRKRFERDPGRRRGGPDRPARESSPDGGEKPPPPPATEAASQPPEPSPKD